MKLGVVGLPNVGKSTLFNAITRAGAECANYPFCTIDANVAAVAVPDERLDVLARLSNSKKITPTLLSFVDIAGLVKGASRGEGLGNKFLSHIREVDAIVHVVRCFDDPNITHVNNKVDPASDIETINIELILADIETVSRRLDKARSLIKTGDKKYALEDAALSRALAHLEQSQPCRTLELTEEQTEFILPLMLLTQKPVIYAANISEDDIASAENNAYIKTVAEIAKNEGAECLQLCAKIENELREMPESEQADFLALYGLEQSALSRLVQKCYRLLKLISFLTTGEKETRAWTVSEGTKAPQAAGKIHTDFEKGFIRAEVVCYETLVELKSYAAVREKGKVRSEGKDYIIADGDVVIFRFNV